MKRRNKACTIDFRKSNCQQIKQHGGVHNLTRLSALVRCVEAKRLVSRRVDSQTPVPFRNDAVAALQTASRLWRLFVHHFPHCTSAFYLCSIALFRTWALTYLELQSKRLRWLLGLIYRHGLKDGCSDWKIKFILWAQMHSCCDSAKLALSCPASPHSFLRL